MAEGLGKIHVYTGDGKGKTTAALGLALRAAGAGYKVYAIQFLKGQNYSELKSLKKIKNIKFRRFGQKTFVHQKGKAPDKISAQKALKWAERIISAAKYEVIILDEIFLADFFKLIKTADIIKLIKNKPKNIELVLTGRKANPQIIKLADYVTEFKEIKHPYQQGLLARKGIED